MAAIHHCLLLITLCLLGVHTGRAERYLTVAEAQKLCFPEATGFKAEILRFTPQQQKAIQAKTGQKVLNRGNRIWFAERNGVVLGVLVVDHVLGKHEIIDYAVAIEPSGKVRQVEILEFRESHGYEVRGEKWRNQFKGKDASSPFKWNHDIFNISGATISCRNVTEGIKRVLATFELLLKPRLSGTG